MPNSRVVPSFLLALASVVLAGAGDGFAATPGQRCEKDAAKAVSSCFRAVGTVEWKCYRDGGAACAPGHADVAKALAKLQTKVLDACPDAATVTAAGYPPLLTPSTLVDRLSEACTSNVASLVARTFGGPQAAVRNAASVTDQACLDRASTKGQSLIDYGYRQYGKCLQKAHAGGVCDPASVGAKIAKREASTVSSITARCPALDGLIGIDPPMFSDRGLGQSRCLTPTAYGHTAPLDLDCGPRASVSVPAPATPTQIVLDSDATGTRCGDGSPYAFWIRLAPTGSPIEKVVIFLPGGGSCLDGPDCAATKPDLFESINDTMSQAGLMSNTKPDNPFLDWTKVSCRTARRTCTSEAASPTCSPRSPSIATARATSRRRCATCATSCGRRWTPPTRRPSGQIV
jgi:hypothetical protein